MHNKQTTAKHVYLLSMTISSSYYNLWKWQAER